MPVRLEDAVAEVAADYLAFLRAPRADEPEDAKSFAARHAAAKAALSHIEQIIKLAADAPGDATADTDNLLHEARHQMDQARETGEDTARDGEAG